MNKAQFVKAFAERTGKTEVEAKRLTESFLSLVEDTIKAGEPLVLLGFGTFHPVLQPGRTVRNPKTGVQLEMLPRKNVRFKIGLLFLQDLNPDQNLRKKQELK